MCVPDRAHLHASSIATVQTAVLSATSGAANSLRRSAGDAGFTLIELMTTMACMLILGAIAVPRLQAYVVQSRLNAAKPYLMEIAAKQRMYKIETGIYCCSGYALDEQTLSTGLGLSVAATGDFCFVFICQSATLCAQTSGPGFIVAPAPGPGNTPDFEVWAILQTTGATTAGPGGVSCTPIPGKANPTGWVYAAGTSSAGRAGQAVALRYAPPANGFAAAAGSYHAIPFDWHDGISLSDAMQR